MGLALCINANKSPHDYLLALAPLLPLLTNLSGADLDLTLKVLTHEEFSPKDIPWKSSAELHEFLDDNQVTEGCWLGHWLSLHHVLHVELQVWERVVVHSEVLPQQHSLFQMPHVIRTWLL